jgi:hypothetical protein
VATVGKPSLAAACFCVEVGATVETATPPPSLLLLSLPPIEQPARATAISRRTPQRIGAGPYPGAPFDSLLSLLD